MLLAILFLGEERFLLIDEPTNHLDLHGREVLSRYLRGKQGYLLVSHDRAFLDGCVDHILAINRADITLQKGNFATWWENKQRQDAFELAQDQRLRKDIRRLESAARQSRAWADRVESEKIGAIEHGRGTTSAAAGPTSASSPAGCSSAAKTWSAANSGPSRRSPPC